MGRVTGGGIELSNGRVAVVVAGRRQKVDLGTSVSVYIQKILVSQVLDSVEAKWKEINWENMKAFFAEMTRELFQREEIVPIFLQIWRLSETDGEEKSSWRRKERSGEKTKEVTLGDYRNRESCKVCVWPSI